VLQRSGGNLDYSEIWWQLGLDLVFLCCSLLLLLLVVARDVLGDEHVDDLQRQHRAELLLSHARLNELALSDCAVVVLVHLVECCLHENLLTRLVRVCLVDQQKQILDYLLKLFQRDCPVIVNVEDTEYLLEILLWRTIGHDIQDNHELTEVDVAILIGVVHSEYVSLQLFCVRPWVALFHHHVEALPGDPAVRVLLQERLVLDLDSLALHGRVARDEVDVLVREDRLALHATHLPALLRCFSSAFEGAPEAGRINTAGCPTTTVNGSHSHDHR